MIKVLKLSCALSFLCFFTIHGQDKFPATRFTFDAGQEGFASWSPDSKFIVYQNSDLSDIPGKIGLWRKSLIDTAAEQIFSGFAEHAKWSPDGRFIVFDADTGSSIKMIPAEGGKAVSFLPDSIIIQNGGLPSWSPDGTQIAFLERRGLSVCIYDIKTETVKSIFSKDNLLPLPGGFSIDGKNILVALSDRQTRKSTMWSISIDGKANEQIYGHHENFWRHLALSPDGSLIIYAAIEGKYLGLWVMLSTGGKSLPLAITLNAHNEGAAWSPDGKYIAFNSTRSGNHDVWIMQTDIEQLKSELLLLNKNEINK